jgi:hypothetical protein
MKESLDFFLHFDSFLMVALPIYTVLRLGLRGVFYGAACFWILGVAGNQIRWSFHGEFDSLWLTFGLPIGLVYSGLVYGLSEGSGWAWRRLVGPTATSRIGVFGAIAFALFFGVLSWQLRPYGMGTSSMIGTLQGCPLDEVRFIWNEPGYLHNRGFIDLTTGEYRVSGDDESDNGMVTITATAQLAVADAPALAKTQLSPEQLAKSRQLIEALPSEHRLFFQRYDFNRNIYLARWKGGQLEIDQYDRRDLPQALDDLFAFMDKNVIREVRGDN